MDKNQDVFQVRISGQVARRVKEAAMERGLVKPSGRPNVSAFVRQVLIQATATESQRQNGAR